MITKLKLLELMSSRMFHDLAGPVGAVYNSIEFLEEDNQAIKDKALSIIKSSSSESIVRLKFFRQAYGTVGEPEVYLTNLTSIVDDFASTTKVKINWQINANPVNCYIAKVILNFIIIGINNLIHGGSITIEQQEDKIRILLQGRDYVFSEDSRYLLQGDISNIELTSANIQIYYTHMMIDEAKATLQINKKEHELEFLLLNQII